MTITGIRADANETVAAGHIMRCLTIAAQLEKKGERVIFFSADEYPLSMLQQAGVEYVCLHTAWDGLESELPVLIEELERTGCHRLLVDSYQATPAYLAALRECLPVIYIDDLFRAVYPVDLLINYNGYHTRFPYKEAYKEAGKEAYEGAGKEAHKGADTEAGKGAAERLRERSGGKEEDESPGTRLLLGPDYVPLREEFSFYRSYDKGALPENFLEKERLRPDFSETAAAAGGQKKIFHVLISCGGGDVYNALTSILEGALRREKLKNTVFYTVVGRFNPHAQELARMAEENPRIRLCLDVKNMAELMSRCDAAVSAAGTVLYELCAMEVPTVFFVCADNQEYDSGYFAGKDGLRFAGDIRKDRRGCVSEICADLERLLSAGEADRRRMRKNLGQITDGGGAARIAQEILRLKP